MRGMTTNLGAGYARGRDNTLNLMRLVLAASVLVWHSYPLTGRSSPADGSWDRLFSSAFAVNAFFAISGFLIYRSWVKEPSVRAFLAARCLRILPAYWVCLVVTAVVIAPVAVLAAGDSFPWGAAPLRYVLDNALLVQVQWTIGDTLSSVPFEDAWNGSLWTLSWEFLCYLGILALGLLGMSRRKWLLWVVAGGVLVLNVADAAGVAEDVSSVKMLARFGAFFFSGALLAQHADAIPVNVWSAPLATLAVVGTIWLPAYQVFQAPVLAYALLTIAIQNAPAALHIRNDLSYGVYVFAFPIQQALVLLGADAWHPLAFAAVAFAITLCPAALSWHYVERPALRLKRKIQSTTNPEPAPTAA